MDITNAVFKRQFSMSMYKNLKLPLGEMTFTKDFVQEVKRGIDVGAVVGAHGKGGQVVQVP